MKTPLQSAIADYDNNFIDNWKRAVSEFKSSNDNKMWLLGPSSYLFCLNGVKFGVDLQIRRASDFEKLEDSLVEDLSELSFVLITHEHGDHMCPRLINELKNTDIKWYIPKGCRQDYIEKSGLSEGQIIWISPDKSYNISGVEINTFYTPHAVGEQPFLQCGYYIKSSVGNILIPGDIRDYDYEGYPEFIDVDLCIAHLWAGKDSSDPEKYIPYMQKFSKTIASFNAKKIYLCHLYEIGRGESSLWSYRHAGLAMDMLYSFAPQSIVEIPRISLGYNL